MNRRLIYLLSVIAVALFACLFGLPWVARRLSVVSVGLSANEESQTVLRTNLSDLKALSRYDPAHRAIYRRHFDDTQRLLGHLRILALSREDLTRRAQATVFAVFAVIAAFSVMIHLVEQRRRVQRMTRLSLALESLSRGEEIVEVGDRANDMIGTFASMIEETSRVMVRERRRVHYLEHLSSWQEAARRHAHEMRTPLTTMRMEVTSLMRSLAPRVPDAAEELRKREESILEELERLRRFTSNFVAFASLPAPTLRRCDLARVATEFSTLFAPNWPRLTLRAGAMSPDVCALADAAMLRQVLVNLCNNSALAVGDAGHGTVVLSVSGDATTGTIEIADDGPGIPAEVRRRLFEPYTTTRKIGEGMGLGLAISKKILLDHGGDLDLLERDGGTSFRLTLPRVEC